MMKILILGGTGAMGAYLVELLGQQGHQITVTSRSRDDVTPNIRYLKGDAHDSRFLSQALANEHWSVIIDFMVYSTEAFKTRCNLLLNATDQYIFLSSARVYAQSSTPLTEESPRLLDIITDQKYLATDEYALTKARQENILFSCKHKNWTIIRPYITFSPQRMQLGALEKEDWLFRALNSRTIVFSKDISTRLTTLTHGQDVAKGIISLLSRREALGEAFHITNPEAIPWSEVLNTYLDTIEECIGKRPRAILADLDTFKKAHPAKYQITYDRLYDRSFNCNKIDKFYDTKQCKNSLQLLRLCLEIFLKDPVFIHTNAQYEALKDLITHERTPLRQLPSLKQKARYIATRLITI